MEFVIERIWLLAFLANLIFLLVSCKYSVGLPKKFSLIQAGFFVIYVMPRLVNFMFFPDSVSLLYSVEDYYYENKPLNDSMVAKALMINLIGMAAAFVGVLVGSKFLTHSKGEFNYQSKDIPYAVVLIVFVLLMILRADSVLIFIYRSINLSTLIGLKNFIVLIGILTNPEIFIMLFIPIALNQTKGLNFHVWKILVVVSIYLAIKIIGGSRAGALMVLIFFSIGCIFLPKSPRLNKKNIIISTIVLSFVGLLSYKFATIQHSDHNLSYCHKIESKENIDNCDNSTENPTENSMENSIGKSDKYAKNPFNRLGAYFDALIVTSNLKGDEKLAAKYLNALYSLKSFINISLPGQYFDCCMINSSFMPIFIFGNRDVAALESPDYYESGLYTLYGFLYYKISYFGLFIGAFSWAFLIVLGLSFIFSRKILKPFYLVYLNLFLYSGMMMQGLDAYMADIVKFAFAAIFMYCILLVFSIFIKNNNKEFE